MNSSIAKNIYMYNGVPINPWKKCSVSLVIRVIQTKATKKYHYALTTTAEIKKIDSPKCWQRCGATGTTIHSCRTTKMVQSLWRTLWQLLIKKNITYTPNDVAIGSPAIYPKKWKCVFPQRFVLECSAKNFPIIAEWINRSRYDICIIECYVAMTTIELM